MKPHRQIVTLAAALIVMGSVTSAIATKNRLKDLVTVQGVRSNTLTGFGIVVGLSGTGDNAQSPVVRKSLSKMLKRLGVSLSPNEIKARNVAAVLVTARLPAFARAGMKVDVTVSSMGEAKSLQGGTLIATPIKGANLRTYAVAQGTLSLGGFAVSGRSGSSTKKNHATVAQIPGGAVLERDSPTILSRHRVVLLLKQADFTTAARIAKAINTMFKTKIARVRDPGSVQVRILPSWKGRTVQFIATLEAIEATPDAPARVIIDVRTGTVVVGAHVRLGKVAIAHGSLTIKISESGLPSQPGILSKGKTIVTNQTKIKVKEKGGDLKVVGPAATVGDVAAALNALGAKPRDLVSIFQALKVAGALRAEIKVL